ncbi:CYTH domain-containing protein [Robertkochia aurantiaca]|uniref:CYTH domain-containing protein n=1 Tax=Robertkochia aurantiaca TaxID=2873700 RepID=UPI001CCDB03E|nr:CYTH domain-containing protein [Robertkochia sp. 3YJGBD-33]
MQETERKFLVSSQDFKEEAIDQKQIKQGFLNTHPERTVRVRVSDRKAFLTVKGIGNSSGTTRFEWETEIDPKEAENLLAICEPGKLEKTRYLVRQGEHIFEVDEFHGENEGLIVAEIELEHEDDVFVKPVWLGKEVTGDIRYYNSQLSKNPYKKW